jgi:hypothetical protein
MASSSLRRWRAVGSFRLAMVRDDATISWAAVTALAAAVCWPTRHIVWEWGRR